MSGEDKTLEEDATSQMIYTGTMWLNSAFRIKVPKKTYGDKLFNFRADYGEIAWGLFFALIIFAIQFTVWNISGRQAPGPLYLFYDPITWPFYAGGAFIVGRNMAHLSPYRAYTGESATQWANIVLRKSFGRFMAKMGYADISYNRVKTTMRDKAEHQFRVTWAREWLGIAPAPYAPHVSNPYERATHNEISLPVVDNIAAYPDNRNMLRRYAEERQRDEYSAAKRRQLEEADMAENIKDVID